MATLQDYETGKIVGFFVIHKDQVKQLYEFLFAFIFSTVNSVDIKNLNIR